MLIDATARRFTQERARKTYEALVAAAAECFLEHGYDATGTPDIAARAGASVGTFYRYFDDKQQIYLEVTRRHMAELYHQVMDQLTPQRFVGKARRATIDETVDIMLAQVTKHPRAHRVFVEMSLRDPSVMELRRAFDAITVEALGKLFAAIAPSVKDPLATALVVQVSVVECASVIAGVRGALPVDTARSKAALASLIHRALFGIEDDVK